MSHTMLKMAKNLNALQYIMNINNSKQNIASFISPTKRVFIGVLSKFPKLETSIFRIAGQPFICWIRVYPLFEQLVPEL